MQIAYGAATAGLQSLAEGRGASASLASAAVGALGAKLNAIQVDPFSVKENLQKEILKALPKAALGIYKDIDALKASSPQDFENKLSKLIEDNVSRMVADISIGTSLGPLGNIHPDTDLGNVVKTGLKAFFSKEFSAKVMTPLLASFGG